MITKVGRTAQLGRGGDLQRQRRAVHHRSPEHLGRAERSDRVGAVKPDQRCDIDRRITDAGMIKIERSGDPSAVGPEQVVRPEVAMAHGRAGVLLDDQHGEPVEHRAVGRSPYLIEG
ncbi:hypothetical protein BKA15_006034 [Microlunatus parietis]|uniref:Uncharacterized protein n=1 Tax=Microlunatus parietis TaxID=682979 RepID=A0A7Y9IDA7_9ACTN|nr:hypothetical protein [Microlunatus parietis]NYE74705.1 hypothetical protein [Microlunatus parietis]